MKETLRALVAAYGPSGRESGVARRMAELIAPHVDEVTTDALGNVIATLRPGKGAGQSAGGAAHRVMLCAHMDQPGLVVTDITKEGLLRFSPAGALEAAALAGQRVVNDRGLEGVVGLEGPVEPKELSPAKMVIDVGAADREAARSFASTGDVFVPQADFLVFGDRVSAPALDNRAGCAILIEVARRLRMVSGPHVLHFVFSVQGAIAPRGARPAASGLEPTFALVLDGCPAKGNGRAASQPELGKGPAIRLKDSAYLVQPRVRELLAEAARDSGVTCQFEVSPWPEAQTDAAAIQTARAGVPVGVVVFPVRYARTPAETVSLGDLEGAAKLVARVLAGPLTA